MVKTQLLNLFYKKNSNETQPPPPKPPNKIKFKRKNKPKTNKFKPPQTPEVYILSCYKAAQHL